MPMNEGCKYTLTYMGTTTGLLHMFPCITVTVKGSTKGLIQLHLYTDVNRRTDSVKDTHLTNADRQNWVEDNQTKWYFHALQPYIGSLN